MILYKNIETIGKIPEYFLDITHLLLSNNQIYSLTGIDVFKKLTHFSIANNKLIEFEELLKISEPDLIQNISVKGNFFSKDPNIIVKLQILFKK
jgi:Leucine-rich repeat (LRR) protein